MVAVPAPTIVTVLPLTVATLEGLMVYVTANPELLDALKLKFAAPYVFVTSLSPVIVGVPLFTVTVNVCSFAK